MPSEKIQRRTNVEPGSHEPRSSTFGGLTKSISKLQLIAKNGPQPQIAELGESGYPPHQTGLQETGGNWESVWIRECDHCTGLLRRSRQVRSSAARKDWNFRASARSRSDCGVIKQSSGLRQPQPANSDAMGDVFTMFAFNGISSASAKPSCA